MEYTYIGDIVNTHGIKGELRLISDFKFKKEVFIANKKLYVGRFKDELIINTYRIHKNYDMVTFKNLNDINDVIIYKGDEVFINKEDFKFSGLLDEEYINLDVYDQTNYIGKVASVMKNKANDILVVNNDEKRYLIPNISEFIKEVDILNKKIFINNMDGLLNDN